MQQSKNLKAFLAAESRLEAVGCRHLGSVDDLSCYAGAMAAAMTVLGMPTTAREAERHWSRKRGQMPVIADVLALDDWALNRNIKLKEIYPPTAFNPQPYYRPGSRLGYDEFMRETVRLYGRDWEQTAKETYGQKEFDEEMAARRVRAGRVTQETARITGGLLVKKLREGPLIAYMKPVEDGDAPHAVTLYGSTDNGSIGFHYPGWESLGCYGGNDMVGQLDPLACLLSFSKR